MAGLVLDPWQQFVITSALGERTDGRWASFEVGVEVARQNGKGGVIEARELTGLYLLGERLIIHSAHEFATSLEAFHRLLALIEGCPDLERRVKRVSRAHGEEGIELRGGQRIRYKTRTAGSGRGFTGDCLFFDEAMNIPERMHAALLPTLSARPNPQVWYTGSAVDQEAMEHGTVFARVRERALKGDDPSLAYFGWGAPFDHPDDVTEAAMADPQVWALANPGLGIRIRPEHVAHEQRSMNARTFAVERLGVGDWPSTDGSSEAKITAEAWARCLDEGSACGDPVCFVFDVTPDRKWSAISVAGWRADGLAHVEVVESRSGTGWVADRLVELVGSHRTLGVAYAKGSPAASLVKALANPELAVALKLAGIEAPGDLENRLTAAGVKLVAISRPDEARACGSFFDAVQQATVRHLGTTELEQARRGAATGPLGDAWVWARKSSNANIAPLVAVTLAHWGLRTIPEVNRSVAFL